MAYNRLKNCVFSSCTAGIEGASQEPTPGAYYDVPAYQEPEEEDQPEAVEEEQEQEAEANVEEEEIEIRHYETPEEAKEDKDEQTPRPSFG